LHDSNATVNTVILGSEFAKPVNSSNLIQCRAQVTAGDAGDFSGTGQACPVDKAIPTADAVYARLCMSLTHSLQYTRNSAIR